MTEFFFDGVAVPFVPGQTVAAALTADGVRAWRTTRVGGAPRGLFCGIGVCFDCLATVDGRRGERLCLTPARAGQSIESDDPRRPLGPVDRPEPAP